MDFDAVSMVLEKQCHPTGIALARWRAEVRGGGKSLWEGAGWGKAMGAGREPG